eukprot:1449526-Amphidinium_carterae.2
MKCFRAALQAELHERPLQVLDSTALIPEPKHALHRQRMLRLFGPGRRRLSLQCAVYVLLDRACVSLHCVLSAGLVLAYPIDPICGNMSALRPLTWSSVTPIFSATDPQPIGWNLPPRAFDSILPV